MTARRKGGRRGRGAKKSALAGRSPREWAARGALALGLLVLGYSATASSLGQILLKTDPERAHAIAPGNGVILAGYARDVFSRAPTADPESLPATLARRALLADPTAVEALIVLGSQAQLRGDLAQSDRIFAYSTALSRRELNPQIRAIEEAVNRGDIADALRHYDIALRASHNTASIFYPTLSAALSEPRIREELLRILETQPVWRDAFVAYAANIAIEPEGTIALFREGRDVGLEPDYNLRASLVNALVTRGRVEAAWDYYRSFHSEDGVALPRDRSRDPEFVLQAGTRAAFDWQVTDDSRLGTAILNEGESGLLDFAVTPGASGVLVSQMQVLSPGSYRLVGISRGVEQPVRSRPYWALTCGEGRELGRAILPNSAQDGGRFTGRFIVPQGCSVQTLALVARSTDDILGVAGQIERVQLVPEG